MPSMIQPILTEEEHHQVARWLGEFYPPARIPEMVKQRFEKKVSPAYPHKMLHTHKWKLLIDRYRQEWIVRVADVPLAHKKFRLEKLQRMVERLEKVEDTTPAHKYEFRMMRLLDKARLEMEEKKEEHTNYFFTAINQASDEELLKRREELLKRIQEFRWPKVRRLTHGLGNTEQGIETSSREGSESNGRSY